MSFLFETDVRLELLIIKRRLIGDSTFNVNEALSRSHQADGFALFESQAYRWLCARKLIVTNQDNQVKEACQCCMITLLNYEDFSSQPCEHV